MSKRYNSSCSVFGCLNTSQNCDLTFFGFPNDIERRDLWLRLIDREDVSNKWSSHLRVCEAHFETDSIIKNAQRSVLKKKTVPKLMLPTKRCEHKESQTTVETSESYTQHTVFYRDSSAQTPLRLAASLKRQLKPEKNKCTKRPKKESDINQFKRLCDKFLTKNLSKVVKEQAKFKCHSFGNRYSTNYKIFCLNLYNTSPQAYNLLSETLLNTPSRTTLKRMKTTIMPISTEVNSHIVEVLRIKASSMTDNEKHCTLMIDSVNLKTNLFYNIKEDKVYGFHEIDGIQSPVPAKYALVAMIHGVFTNYKQIVRYALLSEYKKYEQVLEWTDKLIKKLFEIGLKVRALVSNMGPDFRDSAKERKVTTETPYFFVDSNKIFYIFDAPNLIKSVRNNLIQYNFHFGNCVAKWDHIIQFYKKDKTQKPRLAPKLTESHIKPGKLEKLKVPLAVQLLSSTVAAGLSKFRDSGVIDATAEGTIKLITIMNNLFDFLNSSSSQGSTEYQHAFSGTEHQISFLYEMMEFLETLKLTCPETGKDTTSKAEFVEGFQITLKSTLLLLEELKSEGFVYISTRHLNQDCLENFLGRVRTYNGIFREPTSKQFVSEFRRNVFVSTIKRSKHDICSDDFSNILLEGSNLYTLVNDEQQPTSSEQPANVPDASQQENTKNNPFIPSEDYNAFELPEKNALVYTCAYLLEKCFDQHKDCSLFESYIRSANNPSNISQDTTFTHYKKYCEDGGSTLLIIPNDNFVQFIKTMEEKFAAFFENDFKNCELLKNLLREVQDLSYPMPCTCFPIKYLKKLYLRMRIFHTLKHNNHAYRQCGNEGNHFLVPNL